VFTIDRGSWFHLGKPCTSSRLLDWPRVNNVACLAIGSVTKENLSNIETWGLYHKTYYDRRAFVPKY
jgi:hypothetical protein